MNYYSDELNRERKRGKILKHQMKFLTGQKREEVYETSVYNRSKWTGRLLSC